MIPGTLAGVSNNPVIPGTLAGLCNNPMIQRALAGLSNNPVMPETLGCMRKKPMIPRTAVIETSNGFSDISWQMTASNCYKRRVTVLATSLGK